MEDAQGTDDIDDDLLYNLAVECETLLDALDTQSRTAKEENSLASLVTEYQQRFAIWSAHLGVFATKSQSLDRRLRYHSEIRDVVARLLDMVRRSVRQALHIHQRGDERGGNQEEQRRPMETLERALGELNSLSVTIRRSSQARIDEKIQRFAAMIDLEPFMSIASTAVDLLYPSATQELRTYLKKTIVYRYSSILFRKNRNERLNPRRPDESLKNLSSIPEHEAGNAMALQDNRKSILAPAVRADGQAGPHTASQSGLSTLDSRQVGLKEWLLRFDSVDQPPPGPSSQRNRGTSSIRVGQRKYPPLAIEGNVSFLNIHMPDLYGIQVLYGKSLAVRI